MSESANYGVPLIMTAATNCSFFTKPFCGRKKVKGVAIFDISSTIVIVIGIIGSVEIYLPTPPTTLKGDKLGSFNYPFDNARDGVLDEIVKFKQTIFWSLGILVVYKICLSSLLYVEASKSNPTGTLCKIWLFINLLHACCYGSSLVYGFVCIMTIDSRTVYPIQFFILFLILLFIQLVTSSIVYRFIDLLWVNRVTNLVETIVNEKGKV